MPNDKVDNEKRNTKILRLHEQGYTRKEIAAKMGLTYWIVWSVVRDYELV